MSLFNVIQRGYYTVWLNGIEQQKKFTKQPKANAYAVDIGLQYLKENPGAKIKLEVKPPKSEIKLDMSYLMQIQNNETPNTGGTPPVTNIQPPKIINLRFNASNTQLLFDTTTPLIVASTITGFIIEGRTITNFTNGGGDKKTNHYFTLSDITTFWNTNTIRYEGGSDFVGSGSLILHPFTLTNIVNNINEPTSAVNRYVNATATGGGNGISDATAWTIEESASNAISGMTVWIKSGNYTNKNIYLTIDGTATNPVKFIGYKIEIGDITSNYWDYTTNSVGDWSTTWSTAEMPTLTGSSQTSGGKAFEFESINHVIFKNIQITNYEFGIQSFFPNSNIVFERINGHSFGGATDSEGAFISMMSAEEKDNGKMKLKDCIGINADKGLFTILGDGGSLFDGVKSYNDRPASNAGVTDYHIVINGNNTVIKDCSTININTDGTTSSHGITIAGRNRANNGFTSNYNLIVNCLTSNMAEAIAFRNADVNYNVAKYCTVTNTQSNYTGQGNTGGLTIWGDAKYNVFENCYVEKQYRAVYFAEITGEDFRPTQKMPSHNIVRNCIINDCYYGFQFFFFQGVNSMADNTFINNTFNNCEYLLRNDLITTNNLKFINNNLTKIANYYHTWGGSIDIATAILYQNNNNFGSFTAPVGIGNISIDPVYVNESSGDFNLTASSPITVVGGGQTHLDVIYDYNGNIRTTPYSIGAFENGTGTEVIIPPTIPSATTFYEFDGSATDFFTTTLDLSTIGANTNGVTLVVKGKWNSGSNGWRSFLSIGSDEFSLEDTNNVMWGLFASLTPSFTNDGLEHVWLFTSNGTTSELYLDGTEVATGGVVINYSDSVSLRIGDWNSNGQRLLGSISDILLYNRKFTDVERAKLQADITDIPTTNQVMILGSTKSETTWTDLSGNNNHATNAGGVTLN